MKTVARLVIVALIAALMLPVAVVGAQGGSSEEISAVLYQTAESGSFADNGDGTYALMLDDAAMEIVWLISTPTLQVYGWDARSLSANWGAAEGLETDAVLATEGLNIHLTLSAPVYDEEAGTQSFTAVVGEIEEFEESKDGPSLPESFGIADLSIRWSVEFQNNLVEGVNARFEGTRGPTDSCAEALDWWMTYLTWDPATQNSNVVTAMHVAVKLDFECGY